MVPLASPMLWTRLSFEPETTMLLQGSNAGGAMLAAVVA